MLKLSMEFETLEELNEFLQAKTEKPAAKKRSTRKKAEPKIKAEEVIAFVADLMGKKAHAAIKAVFARYGIQKVQDLPEEKLPELLAELKAVDETLQ